ncbi:hypothetical protein [Streptomyces hoynatensis]|uniref:hypothetical protein n=1 Tax=Streptomyces hoynatensis TaxID=1141874 RepID=UPI001882120F|nr:hypothetical protein [Streptomyces hoynatensis]
MNTPSKIGTFGAGLALVFGAAFATGAALDPVDADPAEAGHGGHQDPRGGGRAGGQEAQPAGLRSSERGYTLVPRHDGLRAGEPAGLAFRILDPDGRPLTAYRETHEQDLHLILVRRDLTGYRHLHPERGADGTWRVPVTFAEGGSYRMFADFAPAGDPEGPLTLGAEVQVAGEYRPQPLPEPAATAQVDGYTVTLDGALTPGTPSELTFSVARNGHRVTDLDPYLGAYGHLVALRADDLAYLHVHPEGAPGDGVTEPGPGISFHAQAPSPGAYRLYLDFAHEGAVHTAEFTVPATAGEEPEDGAHQDPAEDQSASPTPGHSGHGHG